MKRTVISAAVLLLSVSVASATSQHYTPQTKPQTPQSTTNNYGGQGGKGGSVKNSGNSFNLNKNSNTNRNTLTNTNKLSNKQQQGQIQGQKQSIRNSGNSKSTSSASSKSSASVSNSGNSSVSGSGNSSVTFKDRLQAPSFAIGDGMSTAPCQGYLNFGGSFPGGGFGFGTSRTVKFCKTEFNARLYQQYFGTKVVQQYLIQQDPDLARIMGGKARAKTISK